MKVYLIILLILCFISTNAQRKTDAISIFKMQLYLDKNNVWVDKDDCTKNDSLYFAFGKNISIILDTLKIRGDYNFTQSVFAPKFQFYSIDLAPKEEKNIIYTKKMTEKESHYLGLPSGVFTKYILAVNQKTGRSYRIIGFNGNDFLGFLSDYLEYYNEHNDKKATINTFVKNYNVEGVDFKCLHNGLRSQTRDIKKFPCLQRVNDPISIH